MNHRELFLRHVAQTSPAPLAVEIVKAEAACLWDAAGREYIDLIGGISVANVGHRHPRVLAALQEQMDAYLHVMVYGEFVQTPQVRYAEMLCAHLPATLNSVYFTNSGTEAVEGAMKLAKRVTGRPGIVAFQHSYHGSTQGALSIIGDEYWRKAFRPLLPGITHAVYNSTAALGAIDSHTACVIVEPVQAEAGVRRPDQAWMQALREKCTSVGALLIVDAIQTGFGRTGTLWGFEQYGIVPDVLLLGKALGGGMPLGAFVSGYELMWSLTDAPVLGHITTFGGHPMSCAAGIAAFSALLQEDMLQHVSRREELLRSLLVHPKIKSLHSAGLWMAVEFENFDQAKRVIDHCLATGVLTDWFLFAANSLRISPPLVITDEQLRLAAAKILEGVEML